MNLHRPGSCSEAKPIIDFARGNQDHQRESKSGPAEDGGLGADDGCTADDCGLVCCGLCCGTEAACWGWAEDDIVCLMSSSTACNFAMFWTSWSCLAASCSTLRRTASRLDARGASCCIGSGAVAATVGAAAETDNNQASVGARATTISLTASPRDCQASVPPTPMSTATKNRARARNIRLPTDGRWFTTRSTLRLEEGRGEWIDCFAGRSRMG